MVTHAQTVEDSWEAVFEHAPIGVIVSDESGQYVDANPSACRLFGRSRDHIVGHHYREIAVSSEKVSEIRRELVDRKLVSVRYS